MSSNVQWMARIAFLAFGLTVPTCGQLPADDTRAATTPVAKAPAAESNVAPTKSRWYDPLPAIARVRRRIESFRKPEIVEMFLAMAKGKDMRPGTGWVH